MHLFVSQVDVVHPRCEAEGCAKLAAFGYPGERPRRCKAHMLEHMVSVRAQGPA